MINQNTYNDYLGKFNTWHRKEKEYLGWVDLLPHCPCYLPKMGTGSWEHFISPDPDVWDDPHGPWNPDYYHPGAEWEIRTKHPDRYNYAGQQCLYDEKGKLIIDPPGHGTVDKKAPWHGHQKADVTPFKWAKECDNYDESRNRPATCVNHYFEVRPPDKGSCYLSIIIYPHREAGKVTAEWRRFPCFSEVTLTATPEQGWALVSWSSGRTLLGRSDTLTITLHGDRRIRASFRMTGEPFNLSIAVEGQGTTNPQPGVYPHSAGTEVTIGAEPDSGWRFDRWEGHLDGTMNPATITIDGNRKVTAYFEEIHVEERRYPYIANSKSKEVHKSDCFWVTQMKEANKWPCGDLHEVQREILYGYNGCSHCLPRYDTDRLTRQQVLDNLDKDTMWLTWQAPPPEPEYD